MLDELHHIFKRCIFTVYDEVSMNCFKFFVVRRLNMMNPEIRIC